jgi:hypothetical protein
MLCRSHTCSPSYTRGLHTLGLSIVKGLYLVSNESARTYMLSSASCISIYSNGPAIPQPAGYPLYHHCSLPSCPSWVSRGLSPLREISASAPPWPRLLVESYQVIIGVFKGAGGPSFLTLRSTLDVGRMNVVL